ncbi:MAG: RDD family protein [bacterium]|nr:RDD family protein [bacterium]
MTQPRTNTLEVVTPEGISFSLLLAGPTTRFMAWAVDLACIIATFLLLQTIVTLILAPSMGLLGIYAMDFARAIIATGYFVLSLGYSIVLEWFCRGQTVGKRLFGLRVMDEQGLQLQFSQIVIRNLLRFVDSLPLLYLVGGAACVISRRAQRIGDFAANTIVVRTIMLPEPDLDQIRPDKFNSLRAYPLHEARLRQRVTADDARIALQAVVRREQFRPEARVDLFDEIAEHFRELVPFPDEAHFGMTNEQYVRNVLDIVYRPRVEAE